MAEKAGFKTVETDLEELNEKIAQYRKKILLRILIGVAVAVVIGIGVFLFMKFRTYDSYVIKDTIETGQESSSMFYDFCDNILEYSNDGAVYKDNKGNLIWNQAFEMTTPMVNQCQEYIAIYDKGGTEIFLMDTKGVKQEIKTSVPIKTVSVASQGTIAVLMREKVNYFIKLYDKKGKELANGEYYGNQECIPIDIALSYDAQKMAVDMVDITSGKSDTNITFYNFGSVGQNEINNNVGSFSYDSTIVPNIRYISNDTLVAVGDSSIMFFSGNQKPKLEKTIDFTSTVESIFYNEKYIGISYSNQDADSTHRIVVYNNKGKKVMEHDTEIAYSSIEFLSNNQICVHNNYECEIYSIDGIRKFKYAFDTTLYKILYEGNGNTYYFVLEGKTQKIKLS
ncbi:MAG: DUF5711 family protein [Agathobacter sp.]|nr:DUF5711 family protein [Agathobacter sp.]